MVQVLDIIVKIMWTGILIFHNLNYLDMKVLYNNAKHSATIVLILEYNV